MNKYLSKIVTAVASLALVIGVGVGIASNKQAEPVYAASTAASFSRSGSTNNVTGGNFSAQASAQTGYYQDGTGTNRYIQILNNAAYWTATPVSITLNATIGGGSNNTDLTDPVKAFLLDSNGDVISSTETDITSHITTSTGDTYSNIAIPLANNVYGIRISHVKQSGYNVRYYSFDLSFTSSVPLPTYTITYDANGGSGTITDAGSPYTSGTIVTVKDITGFTAPSGKEFSHWYTTSTGTEGTLYNPGDKFGISSNTTLYAQWRDIVITEGTTDTLNYAFSGLTNEDSGYTEWSGKTGSSGAVYSGKSNAKVDYIQIYNTNPSCIITTSSGGFAKSISVTWGGTNTNGRSITIYGKHTAYSELVDLYSNDDEVKGTSIGTISYITNARSNAVNLSGDYEFIGIKSNGSTLYMASINIVWQKVAASVIGNSSVDAGTQWSGSVQENESGDTVNDVVYTFTPSNGAVISASNTTNGTFTASAAGTVTVSATRVGYVIANKAVTVNPVVTPTIILSTSSIEGFTGEGFSVTATYSNLTSAFSWGSPSGTGSISGSITASTGNSTTGTSTFSGTLTGIGTVSLSTSGGGVLSAPSVTFTITESTVEITGLPANKEIQNGTTFDLGALIEVITTGSCTEAVSWTSSVPGVATVNSLGVVTAVAPGLTVVTVTPTSYPAGAVTCSVTVANKKALLTKSIVVGDTVFLGCSFASKQYDGPSSTGTVYGIGVSYSGSPYIDGIAFEVSAGNIVGSFALKIKQGTYANKYLAWFSGNSLDVEGTISDNSSWTIAFDEDGNATIKNVGDDTRIIWWNNGSPRFACYTSQGTNKEVQLWKLITPDTYLDSATTTKTIHGHENYTAEVLTSVDSVHIKFGASIAREKWDAIKTNWTISDYGVMLMKSADLTAGSYSSIEDAYNKGANSSILKILNQRAGGNPYEDPYEGDDCIFIIRVNFPDNNTYYNDVIYAVPYVVVSGQYYFLDEVHTSVHELATNYYNNGYEYLSDAALSILKA